MDSLELQLLEDQQVDIGAFVDLQCLNVFSRGNQFYPSFYEAKSLAVLVRPTIAVPHDVVRVLAAHSLVVIPLASNWTLQPKMDFQ